jgi:hypothetical protein
MTSAVDGNLPQLAVVLVVETLFFALLVSDFGYQRKGSA